MENNASNSHSLEAQQSSGLATIDESHKLMVENVNDRSFVNQGIIAWHRIRKEWVGDQSKRPRKAPREPVISWCTTYDDLLSISQPFSQPIPLSEMVDFLVDAWHEEGLYD